MAGDVKNPQGEKRKQREKDLEEISPFQWRNIKSAKKADEEIFPEGKAVTLKYCCGYSLQNVEK